MRRMTPLPTRRVDARLREAGIDVEDHVLAMGQDEYEPDFVLVHGQGFELGEHSPRTVWGVVDEMRPQLQRLLRKAFRAGRRSR